MRVLHFLLFLFITSLQSLHAAAALATAPEAGVVEGISYTIEPTFQNVRIAPDTPAEVLDSGLAGFVSHMEASFKGQAIECVLPRSSLLAGYFLRAHFLVDDRGDNIIYYLKNGSARPDPTTSSEGARVVLVCGTRVLLVRTRFLGYPGGAVDKGESALTAAVRELEEEVGVHVDPSALSLVAVLDRPGQGPAGANDRVTYYTFSCETPPKITPNADGRGEVAYAGWVDLAATDPLTEGNRSVPIILETDEASRKENLDLHAYHIALRAIDKAGGDLGGHTAPPSRLKLLGFGEMYKTDSGLPIYGDPDHPGDEGKYNLLELQ